MFVEFKDVYGGSCCSTVHRLIKFKWMLSDTLDVTAHTQYYKTCCLLNFDRDVYIFRGLLLKREIL
jgi:hypothetical protein